MEHKEKVMSNEQVCLLYISITLLNFLFVSLFFLYSPINKSDIRDNYDYKNTKIIKEKPIEVKKSINAFNSYFVEGKKFFYPDSFYIEKLDKLSTIIKSNNEKGRQEVFEQYQKLFKHSDIKNVENFLQNVCKNPVEYEILNINNPLKNFARYSINYMRVVNKFFIKNKDYEKCLNIKDNIYKKQNYYFEE